MDVINRPSHQPDSRANGEYIDDNPEKDEGEEAQTTIGWIPVSRARVETLAKGDSSGIRATGDDVEHYCIDG